jgi:hypothetical protein
MFLKKYGMPNFKFFCRTHQVTILSKKAYIDILNDFPNLLEQTSGLKGREFKDRITRTMLEFVAVKNGYCKINDEKIPSMLLNQESDYTNYKLEKNVGLLCTNLNSKILRDNYNEYMRFMIKLFPKRLPGEKYLNYEDVCYYRYTKGTCPKMCVKKPFISVDNIGLIPKNTEKNMTRRLRLTRQLNSRKLSKNISGQDVSGSN